MLLRENGRRHKIGYLLSVLHCLKRSTNRDLGLSVTDIAANQPIHNARALHIVFRRLDCKQLILRFLKGKHLLKHRIFTEHKALLFLPYRI